MPFPMTAVLDDFTRANAGSLGANWGTDTFGYNGAPANFEIVSNQAFLGASYADQYWNVAQFGLDLEVYLTLGSVASNNGRIYLFARVNTPGSGAASGYELRIFKVGGDADVWELVRVGEGVENEVLVTATQELVAGNKIGFSIVGPELKAFYHNGTDWNQTPVLSFEDGNYCGVGSIGFAAQDIDGLNPTFDDFGGGTLASLGNYVNQLKPYKRSSVGNGMSRSDW